MRPRAAGCVSGSFCIHVRRMEDEKRLVKQGALLPLSAMTLLVFFANYERFLAGLELNQLNHLLAMMVFLFMTVTTPHKNTSLEEVNALYVSCCQAAWTNVFAQRSQIRILSRRPLRYF
jgi:hypothetical protein